MALLLACGSDQTGAALPEDLTGLTLVSGASPFPAGCNGAPQAGTVYPGSEVEPYLVSDPGDPAHLVGVWQQDRWSGSGASGLLTAVSRDGGRTWVTSAAHFTRCTGGDAASGGDYERASDPWVTFSPDGVLHQISLAFDSSAGGGRKAVLVSRSRDGGLTWSQPLALFEDTDPDFSLDKESITADPASPLRVYAVWDRLTGLSGSDSSLATGPSWFARTLDGGDAWEPARIVYDPGADAQTVGNQILVLPGGALLNVFMLLTRSSGANPQASVAVLRSEDQGATWSPAPIAVARSLAVGVRGVRSGTLLPAAAVDPVSGAIYLAWQDARFTAGARDGIAFASSTDGGHTWSPPSQVNQAPAAAAFTPALAVTRGGKVGLTYYDLRRAGQGGVAAAATAWLAVSTDQGNTWQETPLGGPFDLAEAPLVTDGRFLGDYQGLAAAGEAFVPFLAIARASGPAGPTDVFAAVPPAAGALAGR